MFADHNRHHACDKLRRRDFRIFAPIVTDQVFERAAHFAGVPLGGGPLALAVLVWLGISAALHRDKSFSDLLILTLKLLQNDPRWDPAKLLPPRTEAAPTPDNRQTRRAGARIDKKRSKHDPRGAGAPFTVSDSAFTQARQAMPWAFWVALVAVLAERFENGHSDLVTFNGFRVLAPDGTTLELDRWADLKTRAGAATNGKALSSPRARLVLLEMPLARLPLHFNLVPYAVGERTAVKPLLDAVRRDDLVLIDRGFWGAGLFGQIMHKNAFFAIRLMNGVTFSTLRRLGAGDQLARWTPTKRQADGDETTPKCFDLRLIRYQIKGFRPSTLVTSVTDPARISRDEFIRIATVNEAGVVLESGLYHRRWEIETTFFELKVTQGMAGSFRSRTTEGIAFEVGGHLLLYTLIRLLMAEAASVAGISPLRLSFAAALGEVNDMGQSLLQASERHAQRILRPRLVELIGRHRVPFRPGRHYARPHDTKPKADKHGKKQPPHKVDHTIHKIILDRGPSQSGSSGGVVGGQFLLGRVQSWA
jgi:Transposase DDE domain